MRRRRSVSVAAMTATTWALMALTGVVAVVDWVAVARGNRRLEYVAKPATMVALLAVVATLDDVPDVARWWFAAAVVASLAGDVFLMLPSDRFVFGLGSFLVAHVAYVVGLAVEGTALVGAVAGVVVTVAAMATLGRRILRGVAERQPELRAPVVAYMAVISAMVVGAFGLLEPLAIAGALLFYGSDATIAWTRFVDDLRGGRLIIIATYHLGQAGLVLSLLT